MIQKINQRKRSLVGQEFIWNKMGVKEFIKPSWANVLIAILLAIIIFYPGYLMFFPDNFFICVPGECESIIFNLIFSGIIAIIIGYWLSCLIWYFKKRKG